MSGMIGGSVAVSDDESHSGTGLALVLYEATKAARLSELPSLTLAPPFDTPVIVPLLVSVPMVPVAPPDELPLTKTPATPPLSVPLLTSVPIDPSK